jgi:hypothetical protein
MASYQLLRSPNSELIFGLRRFAVKLCISMTLGVLLLCLGEALGAAYLWLNPLPSPYRNLDMSADYARELEASRRQQYVPYVEWRRVPYQGRFISVDEAGLRRTVHSYCDNEKAPVIWMFGDSVLWGTGSSDGDTIPSQLAALYEQAGQKACVVNYAEAARVSTQEVLEFLLALKHAARTPDVVVFYDGMNEVDPPLEGAPPDRHLGHQRFRDLIEESRRMNSPGLWFLTRTNTVRALRDISTRLSERMHPLQEKRDAGDMGAARPDSTARDALTIYQQNMQLVDAVSRQYGVKPFFFWYPNRIASPKPLTSEERIPPEEERSNDARVIRNVYASLRTMHRRNFFYLGDMFAGVTERLYLDDSHLTKQGCFRSAQNIFARLQAAQASSR